MTLTPHLRMLIDVLSTRGWELHYGMQLADVGHQILEQYRSSGWIEVIGRAEALAGVLGEFMRDTPPMSRLLPVLQAAEGLANLLEKSQQISTLDLTLLPTQPQHWMFVVTEQNAYLPPHLLQALRSLGFMVEQQPAHLLVEFLQQQHRTMHTIVLVESTWLIAHAAELRALLPDTELPPCSPLIVALLDSEAFAVQLETRQAGARLLLELPLTLERLLSELAGVAWMPSIPYRVLLIDTPEQLAQHQRILHEAGCSVLAGSDPHELWSEIEAFAPETCVINATLPNCLGGDLIALLRRQKRFARLVAISLSAAGTNDYLLACCDSNGEAFFTTPANSKWLTVAVMARARQFRRFESVYEQRRQAWRELNDLKKAIDRHAIVSVANADGSIISVNAKFCEVSGYQREELIGRNHRLIKSGYHPPTLFEGMWRTLTSGHIWQGEVQNRRKDGRPYWVQATIAPILNAQGQPERYVSIRTDITEQKRLLGEQKRQGRLLELQRQALAQFIASQDLAATSSLLLDGLLILTKSAHGLILEAIEKDDGSIGFKPQAISGIAWNEHTHRLLEVAQVEGMEFRNLQNLFGTILRAGAAVIVNDFDYAAYPMPFPPGHPVIHNFLGMPIRNGEQLLGIVGLANRPSDYDQDEVDFLQTLTTTYASILDAARLKLVQQQVIQELTLARANEQTVQPNLLTTTSALATADAAELKTLSVQKSELGGMAAKLPILIAEDNTANQVLLRMQLELLGYTADIAADGAAALAKWKNGGHVLLLTDLNMPGMDGLALTRSIRAAEQEQGGHLPIIAITASCQSEVRMRCLAAGMNDVLNKPIDFNDLRDRIAHWLPHSTNQVHSDTAPVRSSASSNHSAILDTAHITRIVGNISQIQIRELVDLFTSTVRTDLIAGRQLLRDGNARALALLMHKLKSSAQMVGALHFAKLATRLETAANAARLDAVSTLFAELEHAIGDVETLSEQLSVSSSPVDNHNSPPPLLPDESLPYSVLLVDDDVIVRRQTGLLLSAMGVTEILTVTSGEAALMEIERAGVIGIDLLITDLKMPGMDGIEFLRRLAHINYPGDLIIASGVDAQLLHTVADLARSKGLHLRGAVKKPLTRESLTELLTARRQMNNQIIPVLAPEILNEDILDGIAHDEFSIAFQPKVDANTLQVVGVEALARWRHNGQMMRPDLFIHAAEQLGLIAPLSRVLLEKTLVGANQLFAEGFKLVIAFNLSANWLSDLQLPELIENSLSSTSLMPENLILEITETTILSDLDISMDVLTRLRIKGFKLSIDDFGTGYSSMEQLQRIPFGELKIDRSFVQGAGERPAVRAILAASINMARKLNLSTVAEGVETQADLDLVRGLGCDLVQGWLIAKAMPTAELIDWLKRRTTE
ncbi:response regulator receiver protein [Chromatium weissei]|nr:response regulator receiver protein [Chromatium weissei]